MKITPEQLREWAHHTHAAWEAAGEAVILDVEFIAAQFRAHADALEERQELIAALRGIFGHGYLIGGEHALQDFVHKDAIASARALLARMDK